METFVFKDLIRHSSFNIVLLIIKIIVKFSGSYRILTKKKFCGENVKNKVFILISNNLGDIRHIKKHIVWNLDDIQINVSSKVAQYAIWLISLITYYLKNIQTAFVFYIVVASNHCKIMK